MIVLHIQLLNIGLLQRRRPITEDKLRSGRSKDAYTDLQSDAVHSMIMNNKRVTAEHVGNTVMTVFGSVEFIYSEILHISKLSAGWVSGKLTPNRKLTRRKISQKLTEGYSGSHFH